MVILSSPSGAGKTTITKKIQQKYQSFKISVSHTTRKPRPNEIDGVDYYFVSKVADVLSIFTGVATRVNMDLRICACEMPM